MKWEILASLGVGFVVMMSSQNVLTTTLARERGREMARKIGLLVTLLILFLFPMSAGATPSLGVIDTDLLATVGGTVPVGEGFKFPSDGAITVWWGSDSGSVNTTADVWVVTNGGSGSTFTVGSNTYSLTTNVTNQVDGYVQPYYAADLGSIGSLSSLWVGATPATAPDLNGGNKEFFLLNGIFSGALAPDSWIFAIADINTTGNTLSNIFFNSGQDQFSPKTTSTVVPEPGTMFLLGLGLVSVRFLRRRNSGKAKF